MNAADLPMKDFVTFYRRLAVSSPDGSLVKNICGSIKSDQVNTVIAFIFNVLMNYYKHHIFLVSSYSANVQLKLVLSWRKILFGRKVGLAILVPDNKYANVSNKGTAAIMLAFTIYSNHSLQ